MFATMKNKSLIIKTSDLKKLYKKIKKNYDLKLYWCDVDCGVIIIITY